MPKLAPASVVLDDTEQQVLQRLLNRHSTPQQIALRANIILLAGEGCNHHQIVRELGVSLDMARLWRKRWLACRAQGMGIEESLQDAPRSGAPATFELEQILHLFAMACDPPEKYGRPITHWTARELADEMIKQKVVDTISPRHVKRLLCEADLKPHQSSYWLNPPPTQTGMKKSTTSVKPT